MMAATPRQAPITRKIHHSRSLGRGFRVSFRLRSSWCVARISVLLAAFCTTWLNRTALRRWARMRVSTGVSAVVGPAHGGHLAVAGHPDQAGVEQPRQRDLGRPDRSAVR